MTDIFAVAGHSANDAPNNANGGVQRNLKSAMFTGDAHHDVPGVRFASANQEIAPQAWSGSQAAAGNDQEQQQTDINVPQKLYNIVDRGPRERLASGAREEIASLAQEEEAVSPGEKPSADAHVAERLNVLAEQDSGQEITPEARNELRSLAMRLQGTKLQERRMQNFSFDACSLPATRVSLIP